MSDKKPANESEFLNILLEIKEDLGVLKGRFAAIEKRVDRHEDRITAGERFNKAVVVVAGVIALVAGFIGTWLAKLFGFR